MAQIAKQIDRRRDLTIMAVTGRVTAGDIVAALDDYYGGEFTANLIWDYTSADLSAITSAQLHQISSVAKRYGHLRQNCKTAIVAPGDLAFGLGRMYETLNEINEIPVQYTIFKRLEEAMRWLAS
jgi:hypothetical protein